jgi:hypothetical protein
LEGPNGVKRGAYEESDLENGEEDRGRKCRLRSGEQVLVWAAGQKSGGAMNFTVQLEYVGYSKPQTTPLHLGYGQSNFRTK